MRRTISVLMVLLFALFMTTGWTYAQSTPRPKKIKASKRAQENAKKRQEEAKKKAWVTWFTKTPTPAEMAMRGGIAVVLIVVFAILLRKRKSEVKMGSLDSTEFHKAAMVGDMEKIVTFVNEQPENINAIDPEGRTLLHMACLMNQISVAEFLVERGADVNMKDKDRRTPLHNAAMGRSKTLTVLLLEAGAEISPKDKNNFTPMQLADKDTLDVLRNHGATE
jgi:hypothetical protein